MDLVRLYFNANHSLVLELSPWLVTLILALGAWIIWKALKGKSRQRFELISINIELGGIGKVELRPNLKDIQVAHQIWTELVTRKAALPIDPEHDVIIEIYNSWYSLFLRVRQLISDIPGRLVRKEVSTQQLVRIATDTLNFGLRPHLTRWQARFRNWYAQHAEDLKVKTPQEVQREYPDYEPLIADMKRVNEQLIQYAGELQKITRGR